VSKNYGGPETQQAIAKLLLVLEEELDEEWTLDLMASRAGYAKHHFARAFTEMVGAPPMEHLRVLRLHRAAHRLATNATVDLTAAAVEAGYGSMKAFRRAFERELGRSPGEFRREHKKRTTDPTPHAIEVPPGLDPRPAIEIFGPLEGISVRSLGMSIPEMTAALMQLFALASPSGAFRIGSSSPPRGWTGAGAMRREFRAIYVTETKGVPELPLEPWSMGVHRFARFHYEGGTAAIAAAYDYAFHTWMPSSPWRYAFAPVVTLYDDAVWLESGFQRARARIYIPVERADLRGRSTEPALSDR
jgi:AraC family transcriptional regulator